MARRRRRPPVLATVPSRPGPAPGAFTRHHLAAFDDLLGSTAGARAVLVLGPAPTRASVATGLATAAAAAGRRTALLESDLEAPRLASRLELAPAPGLAEYLRGEAAPAEILQPLLLAGPAGGGARDPLVCIVAGSDPGQADLLAGPRFAHAIAKLRGAYELLVVAGPAAGDERALVAAVRGVDLCIAAGAEALPAAARDHVDGVVALAS